MAFSKIRRSGENDSETLSVSHTLPAYIREALFLEKGWQTGIMPELFAFFLI